MFISQGPVRSHNYSNSTVSTLGAFLGYFDHLYSIFKTEDEAQIKSLIQQFVHKVIIHKETVEVIFKITLTDGNKSLVTIG